MKNKPRRALAAFLAVLLLLSLCACGEQADGKAAASSQGALSDATDTSDGAGGASEGAKDYSYIDSYVASLAAGVAFDGASFNIVGRVEAILTENDRETGNLESIGAASLRNYSILK